MLNLKKLLEGSVQELKFSLELTDCSFADEVIGGRATANGIITNYSGLILLNGEIKCELQVPCARCGKEFTYASVIPLNAKITESLANEDEDEFIILENYSFDEEELVRSSLILELPIRYLCKEDCKGLCESCGCDLNSESCSCNKKETDPRWDVLKDFFND